VVGSTSNLCKKEGMNARSLPMLDDIPIRTKLVHVVVGCLQSALLGGVVFGWPSLNSFLTETAGDGPRVSSQTVFVMFVLATFFSGISPITFGILQEATGPRAASVVAHLLFIAGCLLFSQSDMQSPMYLPAVCLLAFSGPGAHASVMCVTNLFTPQFKGLVTLLFTMSFHLSFAVFFVVDQLWYNYQFNYHDIFDGYAVVVSLSMVLSLLLWPDSSYDLHSWRRREGGGNFEMLSAISSSSHGSPPVSETTTVESPLFTDGGHSPNHSPNPSQPLSTPTSTSSSFADSRALEARLSAAKPYHRVHEAPLSAQLQSRAFIHLIIFFVLSSLWANLYLGTLVWQLGDIFSKSVSEEYSGQLALAMASGLFCTPVCAALLGGHGQDSFGFPALAGIVATSCLAWSLLQITGGQASITTAFYCYAVFRSTLYTYVYSFVADVFGQSSFGIVVGLLHASSGVVGLAQLPLGWFAVGSCHNASTTLAAQICTRGRWGVIHFSQAVTCLGLIYVAYFDWTLRRKSEERVTRITRDMASFRKHSKIIARYGATAVDAASPGAGVELLGRSRSGTTSTSTEAARHV